jgi:hypothetical protein
MGLFDQMKQRLSANWKYTQLSFMTDPRQIVAFCEKLSPEERGQVKQAIESAFRWQPVAQVAQAMFPALAGSTAGVSADALDLVRGGFVSGGVELMGMQQTAASPQLGLTPQQQAALSLAWLVLRR